MTFYPSDVSIIVACLLLNGSSSFAARVSARQCAIKWITDLHMARCYIKRINCFGARCQPRDSTKRDLFWFCSSFTGCIRSGLSNARDRCYMLRSTQCRRFIVIGTSQIHDWRLHGHQYNTTESSATTTWTSSILNYLISLSVFIDKFDYFFLKVFVLPHSGHKFYHSFSFCFAFAWHFQWKNSHQNRKTHHLFGSFPQSLHSQLLKIKKKYFVLAIIL